MAKTTSRQQARPRAIILITLDALRADHLGCYGYPLATSPFLDSLAQDSVLFEGAFSPVPLTTPSHTSILTGKYPRFHSVGFHNGDKPLSKEQETTLPQILRQLGYSTAAFVSIAPLLRHTGLDSGFGFYDDELPQRELNRPSEARRSADLTTTAVLRWLEEHHRFPFFLWVHYGEPHGPYTPPPPYDSLFVGDPSYGPVRLLEVVPDWQAGGIPAYQVLKPHRDADGNLLDYEKDLAFYLSQYDGQIRFVDDQLKLLVEGLKDRGIYDDALLIITADHGEALGENDVFFFHGLTVSLEQIRVPLLIKPPSSSRIKSRRIAGPVSTVDIMPTVLAWLGQEAQYLGLQGVSLLPHLEDSRVSLPERYIFSEIPTQLSVIHGRFQLLYGKEKEDTAYPHIAAVEGLKLFDHIVDPTGEHDLSAEQPDIAGRLKTVAESYLRTPPPSYTAHELSAQDREDIQRRLMQLGYLHQTAREDKPTLEWTGERFLPWISGAQIHYEHLHRYAFATHFVRGKKVIDLACGEGYGSNMLAKEAEHVVGIEIDGDTVEHARTKYTRNNLEFIQGSILGVPIEGERLFDVAVCFEAIEHVAEHEELLSEVKRLLKRDGIFIVSTPNKALYSDAPAFNNPYHVKELYLDEFESLLKRYFKYLQLWGQRVYAGSNIWSIAPAEPVGYSEAVIKKGDREFYFTQRESKEPMYLVAIASDAPPKRATYRADSWLVDASSILLKDYEKQIAELASLVRVRDSQIAELTSLVRVRDSQIAELTSLVQDRDLSLSAIYGSRGWMVLSSVRKAIDQLLPPGTMRRRLSSRVFDTVWSLLRVLRGKSQKQAGESVYTRAGDLFRRTLSYYRKHGLRRTVARVYAELRKKKAVDSAIAAYLPELYAPLAPEPASTKVKKVSFLIGCLEGESKRYRVYNIVEGLTKKGIECKVFYEINLDRLEQVTDCDLLVLFRAAMSPNLDTVIRRFRSRNIPIVFDVDDLIFEPQSVRYVYEVQTWPDDKKAEYIDGVKRYRQTLESCDFATCTTEFLANRIRALGKRCFVIPNTINHAQYELAQTLRQDHRRKNNKVKIGYFSGTRTHDKDFLEAAGALETILEKHADVELHIVGPLRLPDQLKKFGGRVVTRPFMPYLEMLKYLSAIDINIAPLEQDNPFTAGKSELKIFEPALLAVPTVASRVDSYSRCIKDGFNGFLAGSKAEWIQKLSLLVDNEELRTSVGANARRDFVHRFFIENVAEYVIREYEQIVDAHCSKRIDLNHIDIAWIIPEPFVGSGGHRMVFRAVKKLSEYGHRLTMYFTGNAGIEQIKRIVNNYFYDLSHVQFIKYNGSLGYHDVCFATHWTTVYPLMHNKHKIKHPFYFVQDYEPLFAPMGTEYILAENTYRMGLTCICAGPWIAKILRTRFNAEADFFRFPVDKSIYNTDIKRTNKEKNIIFFARPEMPRRCYELGIMALQLVKDRLPDVEIILFGSNRVDSKSVPFPHTNLGVISDLKELAELYRNADLGIAFSTTNPSLVPYEMMACGLAVADLRLEESVVNYDSEENVYLLNPVPEAMAQEIVEIMNNDEERQRRALNGYNFVQSFPDEEGMGRRIEELIKRKLSVGNLHHDMREKTR